MTTINPLYNKENIMLKKTLIAIVTLVTLGVVASVIASRVRSEG